MAIMYSIKILSDTNKELFRYWIEEEEKDSTEFCELIKRANAFLNNICMLYRDPFFNTNHEEEWHFCLENTYDDFFTYKDIKFKWLWNVCIRKNYFKGKLNNFIQYKIKDIKIPNQYPRELIIYCTNDFLHFTPETKYDILEHIQKLAKDNEYSYLVEDSNIIHIKTGIVNGTLIPKDILDI